MQGKLNIGDEVEIRPGLAREDKYTPIKTKVVGLNTCGKSIKEALPGGLIGISTGLDPSLTKSDQLVGNVAGDSNALPPVLGTELLHPVFVYSKDRVEEVRKLRRIPFARMVSVQGCNFARVGNRVAETEIIARNRVRNTMRVTIGALVRTSPTAHHRRDGGTRRQG